MHITIEERTKLLNEIISTVQNEVKNDSLRHVLLNILEDNRVPWIVKKASTRHHSYPGGLIVHTHSVLHLALDLAERYNVTGESVDKDTLIAGAILHDVGKLDTRQLKTGLLEHTTLGVSLVAKYFNTEFDEKDSYYLTLRAQIEHCINSHMSPIKRDGFDEIRTIEAFLVQMADSIDSYMEPMESEDIKEVDSGDEYKTNFPRTLIKSIQL